MALLAAAVIMAFFAMEVRISTPAEVLQKIVNPMMAQAVRWDTISHRAAHYVSWVGIHLQLTLLIRSLRNARNVIADYLCFSASPVLLSLCYY